MRSEPSPLPSRWSTAGLGPYLAGRVVWAIGLSLGGTIGYAITPARDLGPRIAVLPITGTRNSDWGYASVPVKRYAKAIFRSKD